MPGFTIHIAVAKEYAKKHPKEIRDVDEFIEGSIAPDNISLENSDIDKSTTHYGKWGKGETQTYIDVFLKDTKVDMKSDYWKGYFMHLLTDHCFYNICFRKELEEEQRTHHGFYYDYDCLNKALLKKYHIEIMENIKKYMNCIEGKTRYLNIDKVIKFIEDMSNINLEEQVERIKQKGMEGIK